MRFSEILIVFLVALFMAAPVVDAVACDDCREFVPLREMQQRLTNGTQHLAADPAASGDSAATSQETNTARDLCPVCANSAAAMGNSCCSAPSLISQSGHLSRLIAFSDPSYSITKPPQN
jgi:hypothetical protein